MTDLTGKRTEYRYDPLDRLTEVYDNGTRQALYRYNSDGTVKALLTGESLTTEYRYDRDKNLTQLSTSVGEQKLLDYRYGYDAAGNRVLKEGLEGKTRYGYDALYRLTETENPHGRECYTYDAAGNRLSLTGERRLEEYRYDAAGRLAERLVYAKTGNRKEGSDPGMAYEDGGVLAPGAQSPCMETPGMEEPGSQKARSLAGELDGAANRNGVMPGTEAAVAEELLPTAVFRYEYDAQGNLKNDGENRYSYDSANRMTGVETKEGGIQRNRYDGEGLRAELEENGELTRFLYSGRDAVAEEGADETVIRYIRGLELLSSDCERARTYYHYACDELGSVTCVTGENGEVLNRYAYDAFGNLSAEEEKVRCRFGFAGEMLDGLTGQYYLRARFYSPVIGRFLQEDTYYGDGLNLYSYCHNNPVRYVDPSGNEACPKEALMKKYMDQGYSKANAERMANYKILKSTKGLGAAEEYLRNERRNLAGNNSLEKTLFDEFGITPGRDVDLDVPSAANNKSHITYVFKNKNGEIVYVGRSSGTGTPRQVMKRRISRGHDHFKEGYEWEVVATQKSKLASQGAEEFYMQGYIELGKKLENIDPPVSYRPNRLSKTMTKLEAFFEELFN